MRSPGSRDDWRDAIEYAQLLLDRHEAARSHVDECRKRLADARVEGLASWPWWRVLDWRTRGSRPIVDYVAAVHRTAGFVGLGDGLADVVHELAGSEGYRLRLPQDQPAPRGPAPAVASKIAADLNGVTTWAPGGASNPEAANREARYRYLRGLETAHRFTFGKGI